MILSKRLRRGTSAARARRLRLRSARGARRGAGRWAIAAAAFAGAAALVSSFYAARAAPGGASSATLTFSGTLLDDQGKPLAGKPALSFVLKKGGAAACTCNVAPVEAVDAQGGFRALLPLDPCGCPASLFDGSDVTVDLSVNGTLVAASQPVGAVPYARYADQVGTTDCPVGYAKVAAPPFLVGAVVCQRGSDEVVRVGTGPSAFWIDRYEASVWQNADGTGKRYFKDGDNESGILATFPKNGHYTVPAYAVSKKGETPSRFITWFQASAACRASGKRLPHGDEWLEAARRTFDPVSDNDGLANKKCNTKGGMRVTDSALAGSADTSCVSAWGAEDMVGNAWEWTAEWYAGIGDTTQSYAPWPDATLYGSDKTWNIVSKAYPQDGAAVVLGLPAAAYRGGSCNDVTGAGSFALHLNDGPSHWSPALGFRCLLPR